MKNELNGISATLTVDEAHEIVGRKSISKNGFYAAIKRGEVPHIRLGNRILIPRHAFFAWLNGGKVAA